jgi:hypothetical protein
VKFRTTVQIELEADSFAQAGLYVDGMLRYVPSFPVPEGVHAVRAEVNFLHSIDDEGDPGEVMLDIPESSTEAGTERGTEELPTVVLPGTPVSVGTGTTATLDLREAVDRRSSWMEMSRAG